MNVHNKQINKRTNKQSNQWYYTRVQSFGNWIILMHTEVNRYIKTSHIGQVPLYLLIYNPKLFPSFHSKAPFTAKTGIGYFQTMNKLYNNTLSLSLCMSVTAAVIFPNSYNNNHFNFSICLYAIEITQKPQYKPPH